MNDFHVLLTLLGGAILVLGLLSDRLEGSAFPPTVVALLGGMALGPAALNLIDLSAMGDRATLLERAARLALAIGLVGVALRVPSAFPRRRWREIARLILVGMPLMWLVSTALLAGILGLPLLLAALLGAILTPTDPVVATPMVTGPLAEHSVPQRLRHTISLESGANDGLAYLLIFLPLLLITRPTDQALRDWVLSTLLWHVGAATLMGILIGYLAGKALQRAEAVGSVLEHWRLVYTVAVGLFAAGAGKLAQSDELLVVFAAAASFDQVVSEDDRKNEELGQEAVNRFFAVPIFFLIGAAIPWSEWGEMGWKGLLLAAAMLLLRRTMAMLVLRRWLPAVRGLPDALFVGWFAPIGVAATYYASVVEHRLQHPMIWPVVSLVVCASVLGHGMTAAFGTRWYARASGALTPPRSARQE